MPGGTLARRTTKGGAFSYWPPALIPVRTANFFRYRREIFQAISQFGRGDLGPAIWAAPGRWRNSLFPGDAAGHWGRLRRAIQGLVGSFYGTPRKKAVFSRGKGPVSWWACFGLDFGEGGRWELFARGWMGRFFSEKKWGLVRRGAKKFVRDIAPTDGAWGDPVNMVDCFLKASKKPFLGGERGVQRRFFFSSRVPGKNWGRDSRSGSMGAAAARTGFPLAEGVKGTKTAPPGFLRQKGGPIFPRTEEKPLPVSRTFLEPL